MGGTGALGCSLVPLLAKEQNDQIYVTSRRHIQDIDNIHYLQGNAKDKSFISSILEREKFDVVVDFMLYSVDEFKERIDILLGSTSHYLFFSSSRVYAESKELVTESSPRLLDTTKDKEYLQDFEYSLYKATEEDILKSSSYKNWTIIRPYKTYSDDRLQLSVFEKEQWADRPLRGKTVVFLKDSLEKFTSLTYTEDAAKILKRIIESNETFCKIYQIANPEQITWSDVIEIYKKAYQKKGFSLDVVTTNDYGNIASIFHNKYRMKYDGFLNRRFSDDLIQKEFGTFEWTSVKSGLTACTVNYIENRVEQKTTIDYALEGYFDRITGEKELVNKISGLKNKAKYVLYRYLPLRLYFKIKR